MQYILVFGAVFLIMLAVILLFFFLINTTAEDVSGQVRKTFLKEMEVFDELYEEKAKKLKKVQDEYDKFNRNILRKTDDEPKQEAAAPSVKAAASMSDIPAAPLRSRDFAKNYRSIRHNFCPDTEAVLKAVAQAAAPDPEMAAYSTLLKQLNDKLTFNIVFTLTGLKPSDQEEVLRSVLDVREQTVLQKFLDQGKGMDIIAFREWIRGESFLNNPEPVLYLAGKRNTVRSRRLQTITAFTNQPGAELFVNGKSYGKAMPDQYAILEWKNVELQPGENEIKVVSINKKVKLMDSFRCKL